MRPLRVLEGEGDNSEELVSVGGGGNGCWGLEDGILLFCRVLMIVD